MSAWLIFSLALALPAAPDTVVVCPEPWRDAMAEWVAHRESQGRTIHFVTPGKTAEATSQAIASAAPGDSLKWIVLVGDAPSEGSVAGPHETPTFYARALINPRWGSEPTLATDLAYGDRDGDNRPDVAVGRIPCDSLDQLRSYVGKVVGFEQQVAGELEEHRLTLVAAPGNFSPLLDRMIESTAINILTQLTPDECGLHLTYANWRSPYCPYPPRITEAVASGLQRKSLAWIYLGHGHRHTLDWLRTPQGSVKVFDRGSLPRLTGKRYPPVAVIVACYTGAFDGPADCLAEEMLHRPGGPLTVLSGSRVTMPYGNSVLGLELLDGLFSGEDRTIGQVVASAKDRCLSDAPAQGLRRTVELVAAGVTPVKEDRKKERLEHAQMYNLLGDPLLRLRRPQQLKLQARVKAGSPAVIEVRGKCPLAGRCRLSVMSPRGAVALAGAGRDKFKLDEASRAGFEQMYRVANDRTLVSQTIDVAAGEFSVELEIPTDANGALVLVGHAAGKEGLAVGHAKLNAPLRRDPPLPAPAPEATSQD